jgi:hypothetical protein
MRIRRSCIRERYSLFADNPEVCNSRTTLVLYRRRALGKMRGNEYCGAGKYDAIVPNPNAP